MSCISKSFTESRYTEIILIFLIFDCDFCSHSFYFFFVFNMYLVVLYFSFVCICHTRTVCSYESFLAVFSVLQLRPLRFFCLFFQCLLAVMMFAFYNRIVVFVSFLISIFLVFLIHQIHSFTPVLLEIIWIILCGCGPWFEISLAAVTVV